MSSNPFFCGNPVQPGQFLDRRQEVRRIVGRIVNQGQSTAILGEPRSGKTSLLLYLAAPETRADLYGKSGEQMLFSYLDAQTLGGEFSQAQFWEYALAPLQEQAIAPSPDSSLSQAYALCRDNDFGTFVLERFLAQMKATGWRLVLLLDEFSDLLHHPVLHSAEFFGSLRSLVTRSRGALSLVIASRRSLASLNKETQELSRTGSPYFNFLTEIPLGPLPDKYVEELLQRAKDRFTPEDRHFITDATGGHPALLQMAASALWEAYEDGEEDVYLRRQKAGQTLYNEAEMILSHSWDLWPSATRRAFAAVTLTHMNTLLKGKFHIKRLVDDLEDLAPELRTLDKLGFIRTDEGVPGGWRVLPCAFLWWMADELVRTARRDKPFDEWLQAQTWEGPLTRSEKQQLNKAMQAIAEIVKDGATTLIQAAAKGAGAALIGG